MKFEFPYETRAKDLWKISMYNIYHSMAGMVNVIFTIAMILLSIRYFTQVDMILKILLLLGLSIFTVVQPVLIYLRAKKQVEGLPEGMKIALDDKGIHVEKSGQRSILRWSKVQGIKRYPFLLIIFASGGQGYILSNDTLGKEKETLYSFVKSHLGKGRN
ncbi:YcxB family protein [Proteiniclasticum ruminis]|uniref:YcxB family protein n=1 Tax=Proteiniclasticum ruminis TaxID=398199 RepID=UPI0028B2148A|nr:YcxB family protein [Proteiniclasticum ruminis]